MNIKLGSIKNVKMIPLTDKVYHIPIRHEMLSFRQPLSRCRIRRQVTVKLMSANLGVLQVGDF